jgi:hypothetical protein
MSRFYVSRRRHGWLCTTNPHVKMFFLSFIVYYVDVQEQWSSGLFMYNSLLTLSEAIWRVNICEA